MPFVQSLDEFVAEHGHTMLRVESQGPGVRLLPDGARVIPPQTSFPGGGPTLVPPPDDDKIRLTLSIQYWTERVRIAEETFKRLKRRFLNLDGDDWQDIHWQSYWGENPKGDDAYCLGALSAVVKKERTSLKEVQAEYDNLPEIVQAKADEIERKKYDRQIEKRRREKREEIERIHI